MRGVIIIFVNSKGQRNDLPPTLYSYITTEFGYAKRDQNMVVLCYNGLNLQRFVWGKTVIDIIAEISIFLQQKMTCLNNLLSFLLSTRLPTRSEAFYR